MTEVWKSNAKKFCEICKVWFADNKASVEHHESGQRHKANVQLRLREMSKKSREREVENTNLAAMLLAMEQAAAGSSKGGADASTMKPESGNVLGPKLPSMPSTTAPTTYLDPKKFKSVPAMAKEMAARKREKEAINRRIASLKTKSELWNEERPEEGEASDAAAPAPVPEEEKMEWAEAKTDDGKMYYFHITTGETRWKRPATYYYTAEEYAGLMARTYAAQAATTIPNLPQFTPQAFTCRPYFAPSAPQEEASAQNSVESLVNEIPMPEVPLVNEGSDKYAQMVLGSASQESSTLSNPSEDAIQRKVDQPVSDETPVVEEEPRIKRGRVEEKDEKILEIERKIYEERVKIAPFGSWTRVQQVAKEEDKQSPLTARYKQEEEEQKKKEELEVKMRPDDEVEFTEKTAVVSTKKSKPVEFKKKNVSKKSLRSRDTTA